MSAPSVKRQMTEKSHSSDLVNWPFGTSVADDGLMEFSHQNRPISRRARIAFYFVTTIAATVVLATTLALLVQEIFHHA